MRVFVSYRSDDRDAVVDIVEGLTQEGLEVWWDQGLIPADQWRTQIAEQLARSDCVVVVWSTNSVDLENGKWVIQEAEEADTRGLLVPIAIDDVLPPLGLRHRQAGDLIDWRGDRSDPRWQTFVEIVRAKLEGREADRGKIAEVQKQSARGVFRGRGPLLLLVVGLAALVLACAVTFGELIAVAIVVALALAYIALNVLLGRRKNERAAATFLRRAFMVTWVTYAANILVWCGAIGALTYPIIHALFFDEMTIWVVDEMHRPVTNSQVTVSTPEGDRQVQVDENGRATYSYPRYWGENGADVSVSSGSATTTRSVERHDRHFSDIVVAIASGQSRFRISHVTLDGAAIDAVLRGVLPADVAREFPRVSGVVRNVVFDEALQATAAFDRAGESRRNHYGGARVNDDGAEAEQRETVSGNFDAVANASADAWSRRAGRNLAWPEPLQATVVTDFRDGILGCAHDQPLGRDYRLILGRDDHAFETGEFARPDSAADIALRQLGLRPARRGRSVSYSLYSLVDDSFLSALPVDLVNATEGGQLEVRADGRYRATPDAIEQRDRTRRIVSYLVANHMPAGISVASFALFHDQRFCGDSYIGVNLHVPAPKLRVSVIENVSRDEVPIEAIIQGMMARDGMSAWAPGEQPSSSVSTPWAGGTLRPGGAIIVPRRLFFDGVQTPQQVAAWRAAAGGEALHFEVVGYPGAMIVTANARADAPIAHTFTIGAGQIAVESADGFYERLYANPVKYVVGSSVEALSLRVNGVEYPLREDRGVTLAMFGVWEVGSCPFVFTDSPEGNGMLNRGQVLTNLAGPASENVTRLSLGRETRHVEIRELEQETSFINVASLVVRSRDGSVRRYRAHDPRLSNRDRAYVVLHEGESAPLDFGYSPSVNDAAIELEIVGYYVPTHAPPGAPGPRSLSRLRF